MKLQSWMVIFAIIIIPIVLVTTLYLQIQTNYINLQGKYDGILNTATYDAIKAFQINEINSKTQNDPQEKIRDVQAAVNTFYNSLATNFGQSGYSKTDLENYIPALIFTLYDGLYIETKFSNVAEEVPGDTNTLDNYDKIQINSDSTKVENALKPYIYYTERFIGSKGDITINYTLDNYVTIVRQYGVSPNQKIETRSGFLLSDADEQNVDEEGDLYEYVMDSDTGGQAVKFRYVYVNNSTGYREKAYFDNIKENKWFKYDVSGNRNYNDSYLKKLNAGSADTSAVNYVKEAQKFKQYVKDNLGDIILDNTIKPEGRDNYKSDLGITASNKNDKLFDFGNDLKTFTQHKRQVIKYTIENNMQNVVNYFSKNSPNGETAKVPTLSENEWNTLMNKVSLISFMQGYKLGNQIYRGYSIVTNNKNREYVDPGLIYIEADEGGIEAQYYDVMIATNKELADSSLKGKLKGYRSIDFDNKRYLTDAGETIEYNPQGGYLADYNTVISSAGFGTVTIDSGNLLWGGQYKTQADFALAQSTASRKDDLKKAYYTALYRERYNAYKSLNFGTTGNVVKPYQTEVDEGNY